MNKTQFGSSREDLLKRATVYASGLFTGKVVVVTGGAGGGLGGLAIATLFARLGGANLAINGRNEEKLALAKEFLESFGGGEVFAVPMTIREPEQVEDFVAKTNQEFGGAIDVLVNNAGGGQFPQAALEFSPKGWNAVIDTNLNGTWWMMQSTARHWVANKQSGSIVNIVADIWRGMPGIAHTCAARAGGVVYLSKSVAVEWAPPHGIRVNCVAPGCCESNGFGNYPPEVLRPFRTPTRCGTPGGTNGMSLKGGLSIWRRIQGNS